jgi:hypothetical protein
MEPLGQVQGICPSTRLPSCPCVTDSRTSCHSTRDPSLDRHIASQDDHDHPCRRGRPRRLAAAAEIQRPLGRDGQGGQPHRRHFGRVPGLALGHLGPGEGTKPWELAHLPDSLISATHRVPRP